MLHDKRRFDSVSANPPMAFDCLRKDLKNSSHRQWNGSNEINAKGRTSSLFHFLMRVVEVLCLEKAQRFRCYACRFWHVTACKGTHYSAKNVHCELFFLVFVTICNILYLLYFGTNVIRMGGELLCHLMFRQQARYRRNHD